jgi:DNA modification methylase
MTKKFIPQQKNANRHTLHGLRLLEKSIQADGFIDAQTAAADGEIISGSARLELSADKFADVEPIIVESDGSRPVVVIRTDIPNASDPRARRLSIAANQIGATDWNPDGDLLREWGGEDEAIRAMFADSEWREATGEEKPTKDAEPQVDRAAELLEKWQTAPGQLWALGEHKLLIGDCTDPENIKRLFGDEKADCVFTSPPYAVGVDYGETYEDTIENLRAMLPKLSRAWLDIVTDGGFAVVNFGDVAPARNIANSNEPCEYPMALEYYPVFRADGWLLWSRRIWCKPNARVNSLWCIGSNRAATDWEHIWTFRKHGKAIVERVDGKYKSPSGWIDTSKMEGVEIGKETHGAGMATSIANWMIAVHTRDSAVVHEPFLGTGTTMVSAENLKRRCYAAEISPSFAAIALERMSAAFPDLEIKRLESQ